MKDIYGIVEMELRKGIQLREGKRYITRYIVLCNQTRINKNDSARVKVRYTIPLTRDKAGYHLCTNIQRNEVVGSGNVMANASVYDVFERMGCDKMLPTDKVGQVIDNNYWLGVDGAYIRLDLKTGKGYVYKELNPVMYIVLV